jgi:hypothetical protein
MGFRGGPIDLQAVPELRAGLNRMWGSALAHMAPADESQPKAVISEERRVPGPEGAPEISLHIHLPTASPGPHPCI